MRKSEVQGHSWQCSKLEGHPGYLKRRKIMKDRGVLERWSWSSVPQGLSPPYKYHPLGPGGHGFLWLILPLGNSEGLGHCQMIDEGAVAFWPLTPATQRP